MTTSKLINYTTREFVSENELELYAAKQDEIFTPEVVEQFKKAGVKILKNETELLTSSDIIIQLGMLPDEKISKIRFLHLFTFRKNLAIRNPQFQPTNNL